jgi:hypothetical protein
MSKDQVLRQLVLRFHEDVHSCEKIRGAASHMDPSRAVSVLREIQDRWSPLMTPASLSQSEVSYSVETVLDRMYLGPGKFLSRLGENLASIGDIDDTIDEAISDGLTAANTLMFRSATAVQNILDDLSVLMGGMTLTADIDSKIRHDSLVEQRDQLDGYHAIKRNFNPQADLIRSEEFLGKHYPPEAFFSYTCEQNVGVGPATTPAGAGNPGVNGLPSSSSPVYFGGDNAVATPLASFVWQFTGRVGIEFRSLANSVIGAAGANTTVAAIAPGAIFLGNNVLAAAVPTDQQYVELDVVSGQGLSFGHAAAAPYLIEARIKWVSPSVMSSVRFLTHTNLGVLTAIGNGPVSDFVGSDMAMRYSWFFEESRFADTLSQIDKMQQGSSSTVNGIISAHYATLGAAVAYNADLSNIRNYFNGNANVAAITIEEQSSCYARLYQALLSLSLSLSTDYSYVKRLDAQAF